MRDSATPYSELQDDQNPFDDELSASEAPRRDIADRSSGGGLYVAPSIGNSIPPRSTQEEQSATGSAKALPVAEESIEAPLFSRGTRYDLSSGPTPRRGCTDVLGLLVLILLVSGFVSLSVETYSNGDVSRLVGGVDHEGRICGVSAEVKAFPLLYWPADKNPPQARSTALPESKIIPVCTASCPLAFAQDRGNMCHMSDRISSHCTWYSAFPATEDLKRYCFYRSSAESKKRAADVRDGRSHLSSLDLSLADIVTARIVLLSSPGVIIILGFAYLFLIRQVGGGVIWVSLVIIECLLGGVGYTEYRESATASTSSGGNTNSSRLALSFALLCWGVAIILPVVLCCVRKRLLMAARVLSAASKFLEENPSVPMIPLVAAVTSATWHCGLFVILLHHYSSGTIKPHSAYEQLTWGTWTPLLLCFDFFIFLWTLCFINGLTQMCISHTVAGWFFAPFASGGRRYVRGATIHACFTILTHHLGSASFGAMLCIPATLLRFLLWPCSMRVKREEDATLDSGSSDTPESSFRKFQAELRSIGPEGYVQVALVGDPFLAASKRSSALAQRNPVKFATIRDINAAVRVLGLLLVTFSVSVTVGLLILRQVGKYREELSSVLAPLLVIVMQSCMYSSFFLQVWTVAAEAVLQCLVVDEDMARSEPN